jgi:hypothetical protein
VAGRVLTSLLVIAAAGPVAGADSLRQELSGGVMAGLSASTWAGADGASMHLGAMFGGFGVYRLSDELAVQAELVLSDKGAHFTDLSGQEVAEALLYLEAPLLARYDLALSRCMWLHGLAGPGLAFLTDSKRTPRGDLRPVDLTLTGGAGIDLYTPNHFVSFDLRLGVGLLDAVDAENRAARALVVTVLGAVTL